MKIQQAFSVGQPLAAVWSFFHDVPKVAECLPGAEFLGVKEDGSLLGKVASKIGPFQTNFEGEAKVTYDEDGKTVVFEGKGVDKKGGSRGNMSMACRLAPEGDATRVEVDADVKLSGSIAQFGRTGLLTEVANLLVADFVVNTEAELSRGARAEAPATVTALAEPTQRATPADKPLDTVALIWAVLRNRIRSILGLSTETRSGAR